MPNELFNSLQTRRPVIGPWSAFAFGGGIAAVGVIPWLIMWSEKAAAVAGSIFTAGAAVIAVILANYLNQRNELNRRERERRAELDARALELQLFFLNSSQAAKSLVKLCKEKFEKKETMEPALWRLRIAMAIQPLPARFESTLGSLPHKLGVAIVDYADRCTRLAAANDFLERLDDKKLPLHSVESIEKIADLVRQRAETCLSIAREIGSSKIELKP